jgi:hypothetical protein
VGAPPAGGEGPPDCVNQYASAEAPGPLNDRQREYRHPPDRQAGRQAGRQTGRQAGPCGAGGGGGSSSRGLQYLGMFLPVGHFGRVSKRSVHFFPCAETVKEVLLNNGAS